MKSIVELLGLKNKKKASHVKHVKKKAARSYKLKKQQKASRKRNRSSR